LFQITVAYNISLSGILIKYSDSYICAFLNVYVLFYTGKYVMSIAL